MPPIDTILLDRDGTLIEERHYLRDPDQIRLFPEALPPMRRLADLGVRFFLVSNQSGIGRGLFTVDEYLRVHQRLEALLKDEGIVFSGAAFCPHTPEADCFCRKPRAGLWNELARHHVLRPESTAMVGDKTADIAFGQAVKAAHTVLVLTGHGRDAAKRLKLPALAEDLETCPPHPGWPTFQARNLGSYLHYLVQKMDICNAHRV